MKLVERDALLQVLKDRLADAASGAGCIVLIEGEAGVGKTSLLTVFKETCKQADLWWGGCDALETPHPLAPLYDIARSCSVGFRTLLEADASRTLLFEAILLDLKNKRTPTLVVIEDLHWADDATLDFLKFLGRRINQTPCLLALSYRNDELPLGHPLRRLLGELPTNLVTRVEVPPLSPTGVAHLARQALRSPAGLHALTQGNAFFVTELLRHGLDQVPRSVQDVVLARYARLSTGAQDVIRLASVVPSKIERDLVDQVLGGDKLSLLEECFDSGLLEPMGDGLRFRHELARVAIEASLSTPATRELHAKVLRVLCVLRVSAAQPHALPFSRLMHHATRACDGDAIRRYGPEALRIAKLRGAHREAAAHCRTMLASAAPLNGTEAIENSADLLENLLENFAHECALTGLLDDAIAARLRLGDLLRAPRHTTSRAQNLSALAMVYVLALRNADADSASREAIALLETGVAGLPLARAYRVEAQLRMLNRDGEEAIHWATKAIQLAEKYEDYEVLSAARSTLGTAVMLVDYEAGCSHLRLALDLALAHGLHHVAANIYSNLGSGSGEVFHMAEAQLYLGQAIAFSEKHEIDFYRDYATAWLALCELHLGHWAASRDHALAVLQRTTHRATSRVMALVALGRARARSGEPGAMEVLDEALELALASNTLQRIAPVRAARAEAAYLRGDLPAARHEAQTALKLAQVHRHAWFIGELAYWLHQAGTPAPLTEPCAEPFFLQINQRWREAAQCWEKLKCPYEQARALSEGDTASKYTALTMFEQLEAWPAADILREQLKKTQGAEVPRGMRASTKGNPYRLTRREMQVLSLLCENMKTAEIAQRLSRSVRTVDHHLASIFAKMDVTTRSEAITAALHADITTQNRQSPGKSG